MENIKAYVNRYEKEVRDILKDLCLIPAPSHHEEKRAAYCKQWLEQQGAKGVYIDDSVNVVFPINCKGSNKITVIEAHIDTVFPDTEPMPYFEDDEKIYSPGVGDDTVCVVDLLFVAKYFIENNIKPKNGILFVCNSCEEGLGNLKGTKQIFADYKDRIANFISFDSRISLFSDRCVGSTRYKVTVETRGGHSFCDFGKKNAIVELAKIIGEINKIELPHIEGSKTTYNVGLIEGGTSVNTIAQKATMLCEYRSDDVNQLKIMKEKFEKIFSDAQNEEVKVSVEIVGERPCADIDADLQNEFAIKCFDVIENVTGQKPKRIAGSTDCNIPLSMGIPAVCVGTYEGQGGHTREEWIYKNSMLTGLEIALRVVLRVTLETD